MSSFVNHRRVTVYSKSFYGNNHVTGHCTFGLACEVIMNDITEIDIIRELHEF